MKKKSPKKTVSAKSKKLKLNKETVRDLRPMEEKFGVVRGGAARKQQARAGKTGSGWCSDRNMKENFASVDLEGILDRLARIPIETWNYKSEGLSVRHMSPMAQDFAAAFQVGDDDKHIYAIDASGVALAAIQGLLRIVRETRAELQSVRADLQSVLANTSGLGTQPES
ncbi:MAG: tail fiber domain-containing protein [Candidatus Acidiferrum sp.]